MITGIDHVQVAIPVGSETRARAYYGSILGMTEQAKPPALARRGGCWFRSGSAILHLGVDDPFVPARKAHPAFVVTDLDALGDRLSAAGFSLEPSTDVPEVRRFHTADPFGNRLEFQQASGWPGDQVTHTGVTRRGCNLIARGRRPQVSAPSTDVSGSSCGVLPGAILERC